MLSELRSFQNKAGKSIALQCSIIKLQWLWFEDFNIISKEYKGEGTLISPRGMHFDHVRTMMEGFALAVQDHVHGEILNCVSGPIERRIR